MGKNGISYHKSYKYASSLTYLIELTVTKLDKNNRIVIDKQTRKRMGLKSGDSLVIIPSGREIRLIPIKNGETYKGSLDGFKYDPNDHKATEYLFRKSQLSKK